MSATTARPAIGAVLLNPGPVQVHPEVRAALLLPDTCHREPEALELLSRVRAKATTVCGGSAADDTAVVLAGSGTAALEAVFSSIVEPDGTLLVLDNGHYGERLYHIAVANGVPVRRLEFGWTEPIDPAVVGRVLADDPSLTHVGMVHHETSTGRLNSLSGIGAVVAEHGRQLAVDAISSVGAEALDLHTDHIDWCVGTANKCLEGLPGVSFVSAPRRRFDELADVPARSFYLDLYGHYRSQEHLGAPMFTPALQVMAAFERALDHMLAENVAGRQARYQALADRIRAGLTARGLRLLLPAEHRASSVTTVHVPEGLCYAELHDGLKDEGYVIYACPQHLSDVFRVANMGQLTAEDITGFFAALDRVLAARGAAHV